IHHILCPSDFSETSSHAVDQAIVLAEAYKAKIVALHAVSPQASAVEVSLAHESGASVTLLHVLEGPWHEPLPPAMSQLPKEQADALQAFRRCTEESAKSRLESLLPRNVTIQQAATRLRNGRAWTEILAVAAEEHGDLIVMGVRG